MSNQTIPGQTSDAASTLIRLLDTADTLPGAMQLRARSYDLLHVGPDSLVVDVGCGAGRAVAELTQRGITAMGVDPDKSMLAAARQRWPGVDFRAGHADTLPMGDGDAAAYRADKVYHALPDPARALAEARRVLTHGGRIVLLGQDWDALVIDSDDPDHQYMIRRSIDDGELAFYHCYNPRRQPAGKLVRVAGARWPIEECFHTGKGHVGLDDYQVRLYHAWYRHITLAMLAQTFLAILAHRHREKKGDPHPAPPPPQTTTPPPPLARHQPHRHRRSGAKSA